MHFFVQNFQVGVPVQSHSRTFFWNGRSPHVLTEVVTLHKLLLFFVRLTFLWVGPATRRPMKTCDSESFETFLCAGPSTLGPIYEFSCADLLECRLGNVFWCTLTAPTCLSNTVDALRKVNSCLVVNVPFDFKNKNISLRMKFFSSKVLRWF